MTNKAQLDKAEAPRLSTARRGARAATRLLAPRTDPVDSLLANDKPASKRARGVDVRERILRVALYHFKSKEQLWSSTLQDALKSYAAAMEVNFSTAQSRSAKEVLTAFIEQFVRMSAAQPHIHRLMTMEGNHRERVEWIINHFLRGHFTVVRDLIRRGQAEGSVRECDPARLYYLIISVGGTPFTLQTEYKALTGRDVFSEAEILRNIAFIYEMVFI
jgi:AcrR family transcriptional regulator